MKKLISFLLVMLCVFLPTISAMAETTTLQTTVPSSHNVTIACGPYGYVIANGQRYTGTVVVPVPRLSDLVVTAYPNGGYGIAQMGAANMDGVTVIGQTITIKSVHADNTVSVSFYQLLPSGSGTFPSVKTGDDAAAGLNLMLTLMSLTGCIVCMRKLKKSNTR